MECARCKTQQDINAVLAKYPNGNAPERVLAPLREACLICSHGCHSCKTSYTAPSGKKTEKETLEVIKMLQLIVDSADKPSCPYSDEDVLSAKKRLLKLQRRCQNCTRSADDNPSNHGQTFVSLDSGMEHDGKESVESREDWMLTNIDVDYKAQLEGKGGGSTVTDLPEEVEDTFRVEFANFLQLDMADKILACLLMSTKTKVPRRYYTIADYAKMEWVPAEMQFGNGHGRELLESTRELLRRLKKFQDGVAATFAEDEKTRTKIESMLNRVFFQAASVNLNVEKCLAPGLTKQAAHARYKKFIAKMPTLTAVAHDQIGKGKGGGAGKYKSNNGEQTEFNFDEPSDTSFSDYHKDTVDGDDDEENM